MSEDHPTERDLRASLTCEGTPAWVKETIETLFKGLEKPPVALEDGEDFRPEDLVPDLIEAFAYEVHRRYNVAVYSAAVWREGKDSLGVTQALRMPDARSGDDNFSYSTLQHFAWFVLENSGIGRGVAPKEGYPTAWPDFRSGGRPSLPPARADWREELFNIKRWFIFLWKWQGGRQWPNWRAIVEDINEGRFEYFDKRRLPAAFLPLAEIDDWDEATTRLWSKHIRSTADGLGRVLPDKRDVALQFRKIDDREEQNVVHKEFCALGDMDGTLDWPLESLLFEKRIRQAADHQGPRRTIDLYDLAIPLCSEVASSVTNIGELREQLKEYESMPSAPEATSNEVTDWHPAASRVFRQEDQLELNFHHSHIAYPPEFLARHEPGHSSWCATRLRDFFQMKPFYADEPGVLTVGRSGVVIGFCAILQYAVNVLRVAPKDRDEEDFMIDHDMHVYGRPEMRTLTQCVSIILQEVTLSKHRLLGTPKTSTPTPAPVLAPLPCDLEPRFQSWKPVQCIERQGDGEDQVLPMARVVCPPQNVFDVMFAEDDANSSDAGERSGKDEAIMISDSEPDTPQASATGSMETLRGDAHGDQLAMERHANEARPLPRPIADSTPHPSPRDTVDVEMYSVGHGTASSYPPVDRAAAGGTAGPAQTASSATNVGAVARLRSFANAVAQRSSPAANAGTPESSQTQRDQGAVPAIHSRGQSVPGSRDADQRGVKRVRGKGGIDLGVATGVKRAK
ncbi:hypothetical protein FRC08_010531 [Ceratobasidium sp. 394]|nr:hypothetical protein FRC08_010531 [Ceratobasidium sp. 394]